MTVSLLINLVSNSFCMGLIRTVHKMVGETNLKTPTEGSYRQARHNYDTNGRNYRKFHQYKYC
jgi:hypothetical protein